MAVRGSRGAQRARTDAERARLYAARTAWHDQVKRRRRRDTVIAVLAGGVIVVCAVVSQTVHAQVTAPEPTPSAPSESPTAPEPTPLISTPTGQSPTPAPTQTPDE
ncbi:hypothetical protein ACFWHT_07745 [Microbacterium sp. NPDC058342]|uniref:hypothetical protein n=1 Tax=Microbacterium sp. NPDC058342 TaxID=3346454 RepID=UPI0036662122